MRETRTTAGKRRDELIFFIQKNFLCILWQMEKISIGTSPLLNIVPSVEECDATKARLKAKAGSQKKKTS